MLSSSIGEMVARFVIGGVIVSLFAVVAEVLRPTSFAGLFGAAPSIALSTLGLTIVKHGSAYASSEARSMVLGAVAFFCYAAMASWVLLRYRKPALATTVGLLPVWFGVAFALYSLAFH